MSLPPPRVLCINNTSFTQREHSQLDTFNLTKILLQNILVSLDVFLSETEIKSFDRVRILQVLLKVWT